MVINTLVIEDNNPDKLFTLFLIIAVTYIVQAIIKIALTKRKKARLLRVKEMITKRHEIIQEVNETKAILSNNLRRDRERAGKYSD